MRWHRTPQKGPTLFSENKKPRFWDMPPKWAPPEIGKSFFPKTRYPVFGTCLRNGHPLNLAKAFFRKQDAPFLGHASKMGAKMGRNRAKMHAWSHFCKNGFTKREIINGLVFFGPKKFRNLPSARRICTKVFRRSHFWTFFLSIFSKFFRVLNIVKFDFFHKIWVFVIF